MGKVISLHDVRKRKAETGQKEEIASNTGDLDERIERLRASIIRVNQLIAELRPNSNHTKE